MLGRMSLSPKLAIAFVLMAFSACGSKDCQFPAGSALATTLKPSPVPFNPAPLFYAREVGPGSWSWQLSIIPSEIASSPATTVDFEHLLKSLTQIGSLSPRPTMLFNFADG